MRLQFGYCTNEASSKCIYNSLVLYLSRCINENDLALFSILDCEKIYVPNLEGVRQLILGSVYSNMGNLEVAKQCYIKAIKAGEATDDVHTSAFASYELGMTLCRNPEVGIKWAFDVKKVLHPLQNTFVFFDIKVPITVHNEKKEK